MERIPWLLSRLSELGPKSNERITLGFRRQGKGFAREGMRKRKADGVEAKALIGCAPVKGVA
jgi:hypothetical protein